MPPSSVHAGGYNDMTAKKLEKIVLPDLIRCKECKKVKIPSGFSKKQLSDLRYKIFTFGPINGTGPAYVKCRICTGQQVYEMSCVVCDKVKDLDGFSKAQRRTPDTARCLECVRDHLSVEPGLEMDDEENSDSDEVTNRYESDEDDDQDSDGGAPLSETSKLQLDSTNAESSSQLDSTTPGSAVENASQGLSTTVTADGTIWIEQPRVRYDGIPFTGYDPHGVAHARIRAPSTSLTENSWPSPTPRAGTASFAQSSSNRKFPRPSAVAQQGIPAVIAKKKNKGSRTLSADGDDDDEDFFTI